MPQNVPPPTTTYIARWWLTVKSMCRVASPPAVHLWLVTTRFDPTHAAGNRRIASGTVIRLLSHAYDDGIVYNECSSSGAQAAFRYKARIPGG